MAHVKVLWSWTNGVSLVNGRSISWRRLGGIFCKAISMWSLSRSVSTVSFTVTLLNKLSTSSGNGYEIEKPERNPRSLIQFWNKYAKKCKLKFILTYVIILWTTNSTVCRKWQVLPTKDQITHVFFVLVMLNNIKILFEMLFYRARVIFIKISFIW